jgi:hypothetical protein
MKVEGFDISTKHRAIYTQIVGVFMLSLRFWQQMTNIPLIQQLPSDLFSGTM